MTARSCANIGLGNGLFPGGYKPTPEPALAYHQVDKQDNNLIKFLSKIKHFIQEDAFQYVVYKIVDSLFRSQCMATQLFV